MRRRTASSAVLALALLAGLAACMPGAPSASPTAPASGTATPGPTPTPAPTATAASVAISAEHITVLDTAGAPLASYDYFQPTAEVVAGLTGYLGAPVDTPKAGGLETPPGVEHAWGGLRLYDSDTPGTVPDIPNHWVFVDGPTAGALPVGSDPGIGSAAGVRVGELLSTVTIGVTSAPPFIEPSTGRNTVVSQIGQVTIPPNPSAPGDRHFSVMLLSDGDTGVITRLNAPSPDFGV